MSQSIKISKGANIRLKGEAEKTLETQSTTDLFAIKPTDFRGLLPKLSVKAGDKVKAGTPLFFDKTNNKIVFCSPVSGEVTEILRGEKRKILEVRVKSDKQNTSEDLGKFAVDAASREDVLGKLLNCGLWPMFNQRPFDIMANPMDKPKAIFVSGFDSSPLAPDSEFVMQGQEENFNFGLKVLAKLADGKPIHVNALDGSNFFKGTPGVTINKFSGPHPAGNVGVQIHKLAPLNAGETVWTLDPQDVANIGRVLSTGQYSIEKTIAVCGSEVTKPKYYRVKVGTNVAGILQGQISGDNNRVISGNVLTGQHIAEDGYLGFFERQITVIPEGHDAQFFLTKGWLGPGFDKFSLSRTFPTWMNSTKEYVLNTNNNGEDRAFVFSGEYEKVFPFDIYPVHLLKAILANDIEMMEKLGIYEVAPEDFALCEYGCTSKIKAQKIVREGLDSLLAEL